MADSKPVSTPMATTFCSTSTPDATTCDSSEFRSILGSLHYLSITRPDIAFSVNKLAQNMQAPTVTHKQALKRILRYLKSTISHGLHLTKSLNKSLIGFCDADWAGDSLDRKSTGNCTIINGSRISHNCNHYGRNIIDPTIASRTRNSNYYANNILGQHWRHLSMC
ncbi:hypothetical protein QL285_025068 [Trifolium repens]|nr:hypothetical protein QL285_025068 [Trifolium repens]